jgi:hypothetical protein
MMKSSITFSSQPRSVAVGDMNNDHQMDIIVANYGTNMIGIFLSTGDGTFADQQTFLTGSESRPYSIVVNDFNNDNYLDIAVANYATNNIAIFLGNGNGTFIDPTFFSLGSSRPLFISTGDFNKDNRTDIVVANYGTDNIGILFGYGNDSIPSSLAVGDFNKDNQLDIAVANYGTNNVGIFLGYRNGTFTSPKTYTTLPKSNPSSIAVADFNNDNQLDIVVANYGTGNVGIFFGHGNGTFLAEITYTISSSSRPQYITVGDLNNDNTLDIVIVDSENDEVYVLPTYGNGSFATITAYDPISGSNPSCVAVADFNNDNLLDLVVANNGTNNVLVLMDYSITPSARQSHCRLQIETDTMTSVVVRDFNNDHILDIAYNVEANIGILTGMGNETFSEEITYLTGDGFTLQYICVGDLNNDNRMDIISASRFSNNVNIFLGYGNGTFATMMAYSTGKGSNPWWIALADVNNDNRLDIVSANTGSDTIGILLGNGDGTFLTVITYSTGINSMPRSVAIGDINSDNHLDIVVANWNGSVIIFLGHGNGIFTFMTTYSVGGNLFSLALADFSSDNHLDIVIANTKAGNVIVFLGYGNGTFASQTTYSTGSTSTPYYVVVADFNNDNISDIAATNFGTDNVFIFYGYGNGSFQLSRTYITGFGSKPYGITTADFDNNKQLEIVVVLSAIADIAILTAYYAAEFANSNSCSTGSAPQPLSVAVGDFNNDNRSDIVVANSGIDSLGILFGLENDTFGMEMIYPIGTNSHPQYVITCDINNDNQLDIVSVNWKSNSFSIIMGYGNGTFAEQTIYSTGNMTNPCTIASGHFNKDKRLDLVVANEATDSIGIFFAFNYTTFQTRVIYSSNDSLSPSGIVIGDYNNDNYQDIAVTFAETNKLGILLGYGNGNFTTMMTYSTGNGSQPSSIDAGDFNNDGQLDIVVTNYGTNNIGILLGYGNGSFADIRTYSTGDHSTPNSVTVGELNNDGRLDIVVANGGTNNIGVLLGYGNGTFSIVKKYSTGEGSVPYKVILGDLNNDGRLDIAVASLDARNVGVFLGNGDGTFGTQMIFSTDYYTALYSITIGDFNGDNKLDIAAANEGAVGILFGYGNGTFTAMSNYSTGIGSLPIYVSTGDFNNDNHLDIAVANTGTNNVVVLFGFGDGTFLLGNSYSTNPGSLPNVLGIGDFNNDIRLDIVVGSMDSNNIGIFLGYGSEPFGAMTPYRTGDRSQPNSIAIGDFNNDSWSDIAVANYGADNVGVFLGLNGIFILTMTYSTGIGSAPYSVAVSDFNNDNQLDIVVTNSGTDNIAILFGYGNGTFASGVTYSTGAGSQPYMLTIDDFNNDNISDIAVTNFGTSNIFLLYGYRNGTFGNGTSYPFGYGYQPDSIAAEDLNEDGWMDMVIACYSTDRVETLIKMC